MSILDDIRIRSFGFLAGPHRARQLQLARQLHSEAQPDTPALDLPASFLCPVCRTPMTIVERFTNRSSMVPAAVVDGNT